MKNDLANLILGLSVLQTVAGPGFAILKQSSATLRLKHPEQTLQHPPHTLVRLPEKNARLTLRFVWASWSERSLSKCTGKLSQAPWAQSWQTTFWIVYPSLLSIWRASFEGTSKHGASNRSVYHNHHQQQQMFKVLLSTSNSQSLWPSSNTIILILSLWQSGQKE